MEQGRRVGPWLGGRLGRDKEFGWTALEDKVEKDIPGKKRVITALNPKFKTMEPLINLPSYTRAELALRNGQDRPEIWLAWEGLIYDLSESRLWKNGKHYEHWAGQDLTEELSDSPHGLRVFEGRVPIGILVPDVQ